MISAVLVIRNEEGIHARPASEIVELSNKFSSDIFLIKDGIKANAKSIMNILFLAAEPGSTIIAEADGPDEKEALEALNRLFEAKFSDEDRPK